MVVVVQLVRMSDCDSEGRGFEPHHPPNGEVSIMVLQRFAKPFIAVKVVCGFESLLLRHQFGEHSLPVMGFAWKAQHTKKFVYGSIPLFSSKC